jgi:formyltetrahydrofolate deformylase
VTGEGANIAEVQMYNYDETLFAMVLRIEFPENRFMALRSAMVEIGRVKNLSIRVWSPELRAARPRLAICTTFRQESPLALLRAIRDGKIKAEAAVMIGNRPACRGMAEQFHADWHMIGDAEGKINDEQLVDLCDQYEVDYVVLARFMRVLTPATCWKYAGGRIINLHHGLLPSFPGLHPYQDAYASRMLTYGATCHFIVPDLDAGNQIIHQSTFTVPPGATLDEVVRIGQEDNEPCCLVEGVRRAVSREVRLHFHRVVARKA